MSKKSDIIESMARTLFVETFADACDNIDQYPDFYPAEQVAGAGEDWFDTITDPTPPEACKMAQKIIEDFEWLNRRSIEDAFDEWAAIPRYAGSREANAGNFGYALAMQSLGHGVGLWDDTQEEPVKSFDVSYFEFFADSWL